MKKPPSRRTPAAGRAGRAMAVLGGVRRTTLLLVLAAVVLSLGMVAGNGAGEGRPASFSEIAQTDARASAVELSRLARTLADAEDSGQLAAELSRQAAVLDEQSVLLTRPGSFRPGVPPFPAASSGAASSSAPVSPGVESGGGASKPAAAYIRSVTASARHSLDAALRADAGTARLLAATGAAQQVLASRAAEAAGLDSPEPWTPVAQAAPAPDSNHCAAGAAAESKTTSWSGTRGSGSAPDAAAALQAAVDAEFGAAYAYEVGMARTANARVGAALADRREEHLAAGAEGVQLLPEVCLPALTPAPAFSLPASFEADPAEALDALQASLPAVYADLAALGNGSVRAWAVERLAELCASLYTESGPVPAAPGLEPDGAAGLERDGAAGLPQAAGTA
ncbi:DUF4439 domain-containing protein [Arthrobacter sp. ATA002]|uniref:DUF4439 domain-containing protein n=1 Tax=Arthrobacter sp. ATA002 TaxID=2991715 RepID=UPI0022A6B029|nr:DUF4439 domain-containing protein [Arthrobacter sp. ATA002]WAP51040.1 DUF4439 domain-containing protein [Arthrobacter sp. ATA002]